MPIYDMQNDDKLATGSNQSILETNTAKEKKEKNRQSPNKKTGSEKNLIESSDTRLNKTNNQSKSSSSDIDTSIRQKSDLEKWSKLFYVFILIFHSWKEILFQFFL